MFLLLGCEFPPAVGTEPQSPDTQGLGLSYTLGMGVYRTAIRTFEWSSSGHNITSTRRIRDLIYKGCHFGRERRIRPTVSAEWLSFCTIHNLKKIFRYGTLPALLKNWEDESIWKSTSCDVFHGNVADIALTKCDAIPWLGKFACQSPAGGLPQQAFSTGSLNNEQRSR